jgi:hypothetical protein
VERVQQQADVVGAHVRAEPDALLDGVDEIRLEPVQRLDGEPDVRRAGVFGDLRQAFGGPRPLRRARAAFARSARTSGR